MDRRDETTTGGGGDGRRDAGKVLLALLAFGVVASLLNAETMYRTAQEQPSGWRRNLAVDVAGWVRDVSDAVGLDEPRDELEAAVRSEPTVTVRTPIRPPGNVLAGGATTTTAPRRVPTREDPLRVLVVGDSLMFDAAPGIERRLSALPQVRYETATWLGSGLSNPEHYDWPARMAQLVGEVRPEVVVVMFGGNDWEPRQFEGGTVRPGEPAWRRFYQGKVDEALGILTAGGADVYWLGMPHVRPEKIEAAVPLLNEIYRDAARRWPTVTFVDGAAALAGPDGGFTPYLQTADGKLVEARKPDGIHFFDPGADRLADAVMAAVGRDWRLAG